MEPALPLGMNIGEVIRHCAGLERLIAEVYDAYAARWPRHVVAPLWRELAREERMHGELLDEAARMPPSCRDDAGLDAKTLERIRNAVLARLPNDESTPDRALAAALDLEDLELDNVYRRLFALTTDDCRMSSAFRTALGQLGRHEARILTAIELHSTDPSLLARAAHHRERLLRSSVAHAV
jgi:hypothetical protein